MNAPDHPSFRFEDALRREADHVLEDLVFQRSPVQSRLLRYLVERELANLPAPSQYEIAVDGLGRSADYDINSDSYPRVQISRLRKNLDDYYSRHQPVDGMRIALHTNSYRIILIPKRRPTSQPDGLKARAKVRKPFDWRKGLLPVALVMLILGVVVVMGFNTRASGTGSDAGAGKVAPAAPLLELRMAVRPDLRNSDLQTKIGATAAQIAEVHLTGSLVSNFAPDEAIEELLPDYRLEVDIGQGASADSIALVSLRDSENELIYTGTVAYDPARSERFLQEFEATMIFLTSPNGVIADREKEAFSDPASSDYACFLSIEDKRSTGGDLAQLLEECIATYPDSEYQAFWLARRAFMGFQADILGGHRPGKDHPAWKDIERAFELDKYNPFANFVAAKVELANGSCENALVHIEHALDRGSSYPTLVAAIDSEASGCFEQSERNAFGVDRIRSIERFNPSPEPLLHLYLMFSALRSGDVAIAREVADRRRTEDPMTQVEVTSDLVRRALNEPGFGSRNRGRLRANISLYVWNDRSVDRILNTLS